jgi:hypothetical protein
MKELTPFAKGTVGLLTVFFFINFMPGCGGLNIVEESKDPIEILEGKWAAYDFQYGKDWEVAEWGWFVLRTPQFVDGYYRLLREKRDISDEQIRKEKAIVEKYLVIEASLEYRDKKFLEEGNWEFELTDDKANKYEPIRVDASPITRGEEYTASYEAFRPVTLEKKRGGATVESITPTFYSPQKAHNWCRTYVLYFPKNQPDSDIPILNENIKELEIEAKLPGLFAPRARLTGEWKVEKLPFRTEN